MTIYPRNAIIFDIIRLSVVGSVKSLLGPRIQRLNVRHTIVPFQFEWNAAGHHKTQFANWK